MKCANRMILKNINANFETSSANIISWLSKLNTHRLVMLVLFIRILQAGSLNRGMQHTVVHQSAGCKGEINHGIIPFHNGRVPPIIEDREGQRHRSRLHPGRPSQITDDM